MKLIQSFPLGLQSALSLKGDGIPQQLADSVAGTIELLPFYLLSIQETVETAPIAAALGNVLFTQSVPSGETWYVWAYNVFADLGVGTALRMSAAIDFTGKTLSVGPVQSAAASERIRCRGDGAMILTAGSFFGFCCEQVTGAVNVTGRVVFSRLRT